MNIIQQTALCSGAWLLLFAVMVAIGGINPNLSKDTPFEPGTQDPRAGMLYMGAMAMLLIFLSAVSLFFLK